METWSGNSWWIDAKYCYMILSQGYCYMILSQEYCYMILSQEVGE